MLGKCAGDWGVFYFSLAKCPCFHFGLLLVLTTTPWEGPQVRPIGCINFGETALHKDTC